MPEDLHPAWMAFWQLHRTRFTPFGPEPIHVSEILAWLDLAEIRGVDVRTKWAACIMALDSRILALIREKAKE